MKKLIIAVVMLALIAGAGAVGGFLFLESATKTPANADDSTEVIFEVKKGASARGLGAELAEAGFIQDKNIWRYFLWKRKRLDAKAGKHKISKSMDMEGLAIALEGVPISDSVPFTIVEGWRLRDIDKALTQKGLIKPGEYIALGSNPKAFKVLFPAPDETLEGYLYPETYGVSPDRFDLKNLMQRQLDAFSKRFYERRKDAIAKSGRTLHELVTMASMLEREEPMPSQRPLVAGILWKRIDMDFPLGVDATSRYELEEWNNRKKFLVKLRDKTNRYNTRYRTGLPPTPIGAATLESLEAAMNPKKSKFLYYLHDKDKILRPSRNAAEHEALRKKYNVY